MPRMKTVRSLLALAGLAALCGGALLTAIMAGDAAADTRKAQAGQGPAGQGQAKPWRIVSLNVCADQYLLALADREQIAGLTPNVKNPELSAAAAQVKGLHVLGQSAEEILEIDPDLVVGMPARGSAVVTALGPQDYRLFDLADAENYAEITVQMRRIAAAIGQRERGEAVIADMERQLAALPRAGAGRVAAYYQRRGYLTGTGTLVDDLMQRTGLVNLAQRLGKPTIAHLSLEELVAARPDFIIVESATDRVMDQGTEMLHHPALRDIPRIRLPQAWTVCGGPAYVRAARSLAVQLGAF